MGGYPNTNIIVSNKLGNKWEYGKFNKNVGGPDTVIMFQKSMKSKEGLGGGGGGSKNPNLSNTRGKIQTYLNTNGPRFNNNL